MNIARHLERSAVFFPDRPAVRAEDREISYSGLLTGDELALLVNHSKPRFMFTNAAKLGALFAFEWNSKKSFGDEECAVLSRRLPLSMKLQRRKGDWADGGENMEGL